MSKMKKALSNCDKVVLMGLAVKMETAVSSVGSVKDRYKEMVELIGGVNPAKCSIVQVSIDGKEFECPIKPIT
ncbi:MAG TPA: hypothetical protein ENI07_14570 [Desulfobacterales bacterium]|nr:hypothetical protein [Desulfobacterales bacterium]